MPEVDALWHVVRIERATRTYNEPSKSLHAIDKHTKAFHRRQENAQLK